MPTGPRRTATQLEQGFRGLCASVQRVPLRALLGVIFAEDTNTWRRFRLAPAAKRYHQAYAHGLLEHSLSVAEAVSALAGLFPAIDRDLAVSAALLHDIGKIDTYALADQEIEMTDAGRLHGEIVLGYTRVEAAIRTLPEFPVALREALLHIILSHHGSLEHGSPVVPCTREATLVHMADNLGSKLGSFDRIEDALGGGSRWGAYDRALGTAAYFGSSGSVPGQLAAAA